MGYNKTANPLAEEYLLKAMELDPGDTIVIPYTEKHEAESFRYQIFQTRKLLQTRTPLAHAVIVELRKDGDTYFLMLRRTAGSSLPATIVKADGTKATFRADSSKRKEKIYAMLLDGLPKEEITEVLDGLSEDEEHYLEEKRKVISDVKSS